MNIDDLTLVNYIKKKYPRVIFTPLRLTSESSPKNALGFVISDNKLIIGYITKSGSICKLMEPIDLNSLSHSQFINLLSKIPLAVGFNESNKQTLLNILQDKDTISVKEHQNVIEQIQKAFKSEFDIKYNMLIITNEEKNQNDVLFVKKEYQSKMDDIKQKYDKDIEEYNQKVKELQDAQEMCKTKLLSEKEQIILAIQNFRHQMTEYISKVVKDNGNGKESNSKLNEMYTQLLLEKSSIEISMSTLTEQEKQHLQIIEDNKSQISEFTTKLNNKEEEVSMLNGTIEDIQAELNIIKDQFSEKELENVVLAEFKTNCLEQILNQKDQIIEKIKEYNNQWIEWAQKNNYNVEEQKDNLKNELDIIYRNLKKVLNSKDKYLEELGITNKEKDVIINKLKSNISDIKLEVDNSLNEQLIQLSLKNQELQSNILDNTEELKIKDVVIMTVTHCF